MGFFVKYPITMHVDNIGDIFLSDNKLVSQQTKPIDTRHHFVWDYIEDERVNIIFSIQKKISNGPFHLLTLRHVQYE